MVPRRSGKVENHVQRTVCLVETNRRLVENSNQISDSTSGEGEGKGIVNGSKTFKLKHEEILVGIAKGLSIREEKFSFSRLE